MRSNLVLLRASRIASYERRHGDCGRLCALSPFFFSHSYRGTAHSITDWLIAGPVGHKNLRSRALNQHGTEIPSVSGREGEDRADHNCSKSSFKQVKQGRNILARTRPRHCHSLRKVLPMPHPSRPEGSDGSPAEDRGHGPDSEPSDVLTSGQHHRAGYVTGAYLRLLN